MTVDQQKVFSFNGVDFTTQRAFAAAFPAFRSYSAEVARGEVKNVMELERLIAQRQKNHAVAVRSNAKRASRIRWGREEKNNG